MLLLSIVRLFGVRAMKYTSIQEKKYSASFSNTYMYFIKYGRYAQHCAHAELLNEFNQVPLAVRPNCMSVVFLFKLVKTAYSILNL